MPPRIHYQQKWAFTVDVDNIPVGRFSKGGPVKQALSVTEQNEGGNLLVVDITPTKLKTEKFRLERGSSDDDSLWQWWKKLTSGIVERRNVTINAQDARKNVVVAWNYANCILVEFEAGDFDAKSDDNVIESVTVQPLDLDRALGVVI